MMHAPAVLGFHLSPESLSPGKIGNVDVVSSTNQFSLRARTTTSSLPLSALSTSNLRYVPLLRAGLAASLPRLAGKLGVGARGM